MSFSDFGKYFSLSFFFCGYFGGPRGVFMSIMVSALTAFCLLLLTYLNLDSVLQGNWQIFFFLAVDSFSIAAHQWADVGLKHYWFFPGRASDIYRNLIFG